VCGNEFERLGIKLLWKQSNLELAATQTALKIVNKDSALAIAFASVSITNIQPLLNCQPVSLLPPRISLEISDSDVIPFCIFP